MVKNLKTLVVLSGKGGVGKTMTTSSLALVLLSKAKLVAVDCDVDMPNLALALGMTPDMFLWKEIETSEKARLVKEKCRHCKKCLNTCVFSAISWNAKERIPVFDKFACEGCGACMQICPYGAIVLEKVKNGRIGIGKSSYGFYVVTGQLEIGESGSGKIVTELRQEAMKYAMKEHADLLLIDAPAGIGCPVIASLRNADYVVAVTEPTPAALHDLTRALSLAKHFALPVSVIINRYDINTGLSAEIEKELASIGVDVLAKIPYDKKFIEATVNLKPVVVYHRPYRPLFEEIAAKLLVRLGLG